MAPHPTVEEIKAAIASANRARRDAQRARDASALAAAIRAQLTAKRRAGALLDAKASLGLVSTFGKAMAEHYLMLGRLTDDQFAAKIEAVTCRAVSAVTTTSAGGPLPRVRMALTPWKQEPDGTMSRTLTAADDEVAARGRK